MGRRRELDRVLDAATRAPADGLATVLVSGEAGIGKSTLLRAAGAALGAQRWRVWPVRADALQRRIPYAALADALRTLTGIDNSYSAGLLRDARAAFDVLDAPREDIWFGRACEAMTRLLTALTAAGQLAIAIDDLDQLDEDSQALLTVCLRRLSAAPLAVLATVRTGQEPAMIETLAAGGELTRVALGPVPAADLGAIVSPVLGALPDPGLIGEIETRADGNPFFATELARSLLELELIAVDTGTARLTANATEIRLTRREAVLRRVAPLAAHTRTVAGALAVFRRVRLDQLDLLAQVASLPLMTVAEALDELLRQHVITLTEERRYLFAHAIVAEALYAENGPALRRRLHARIAAGMGADRERGLPTDLLELAWHLSESAQPGDLAAVVVLTEAADEARARAPERAVQLCERALELLPPGSALRPGIESIRCRALARASRPADAVAAGLVAMASLPAGRDRTQTATALVSSLFSTGRIAEAIAVVDGELGAEDPAPSLRAARALLLAWAGRDADAVAEIKPAERAADGASPAQRVQAYSMLTMLSSMLFRHEHTAGYADRALDAAGSAGTLRLQALAVGASTSALAGLVHDAGTRLAKAETLRRETSLFRGELLITEITLDWLRGRWDTALRGLSTVAAEFAANQQAMLSGAAHAIELDIRSWRGELDLAATLAERPAPHPRNMAGLHLIAMSDYLTARGDHDAAERALEPVLAAPVTMPYGCILLGRLIELFVAADRPAEAAGVLERLVEVSTGRFAPWSKVTLLRAIGMVRGDLDALRAAAAEAQAADLVFEQARAVLALGLRSTGVTEELVGAYQAFAGMGAHGLRRATGRRLRELGAKVPRARSRAPGLLSEAEEKIARLVRQGMRNREIAAALNYSPRSIEVYLSRIYAKLKISSRLELARVLDAAERLG